jgi:hypothetical protein
MLLEGYNNQQEMYYEILQSNNEMIILLKEYDCVIDSKDDLKESELSTFIEESGRQSESVQVDIRKPEPSTFVEESKRQFDVKSESIGQSNVEKKLKNLEKHLEFNCKELKVKIVNENGNIQLR